MSQFSLGAYLTSLTTCSIALFVFLYNRKSITNKIFSLYSLSISVWSFFTASHALVHSQALSLFLAKMMNIGVLFIPILFFHFCLVLLNSYEKYKNRLFIGYFICATLIIINFTTSLLIPSVRPKLGYYYFMDAGSVYPLLVGYFTIYVIFGLYLLSKAYFTSLGNRRNQLKYLLSGSVIGYAFGISNFLPVYDITIFPYPFGSYAISLYVGIAAYAIIRHHLMDVEVIVKRTLVFAGLSAFVLGIIVITSSILQEAIGELIGLSKAWAYVLTAVIIIVLYEPVKNYLVIVTDKYLFQKKYDYKHLIRDFMDELKTMVLNTTDIAQSTIDFLNASIRPTISAIFMYNKFTSRYDLIASSDFKDKALKISSNSGLVKILGDTGKIVTIKAEDRLSSLQESVQLTALGVELIIPLLIHKELIGFLCLGKKKSDEGYSEDDTEALSDLSGALAISLNNAQLFDERADAEKRALVGTIATGINHEIGNPLNIITIKLDTFRILAKEGLLTHKTKEEIIDEVDKITKVCLDSAQRIAEITRQVSEFAKPDKKLIFDKVNVNEVIDETMAFLKHGMILDIGKIEKRIVCEPVYVLADRGQLKQILFNLIKNASHAIDKEKGKIVITVDKNTNGEIAIKIIDNGHGMPKEVKDKVFTPFFTTKEPGKGTGLGLALVKIMIDRNNAKIKVESEEEKGTTFTLIFKGGLL